MQDAQVPTDSDDGANDSPRRANLRLRDAEAVATNRRDMFGDGSLLDTLAGSPAAPGATGGSADPTTAPQSAEGDVAEGDGAAARQVDPAEGASTAAPGSFADTAQTLDAIIDSFPAEPVAGTPHAHPALGTGAEASEPPRDAAPTSAASQMGISSLFDSLGSIEQRADDAPPAEKPPVPSAPTLALDMSMLELRVPTRSMQPERDPPAAAPPEGAPPLPSMDPDAQAYESQAHEGQTDEVQAGGPDLDMSMLQRPTARPVLRPDDDSYQRASPYRDHSPDGEFHADGIQTGELETHEPRMAEAAFANAIDASSEPDAFVQDSEGRPFANIARSLPFSGGAASPQPLIEPLVMPAFAEPSEPARYAEPIAAPSFSEPQVLPAYPDPAEPAAQPMFDTEAEIAAEAQATADALDNLKSLLAHSVPRLEEPIQPRDHGLGHGHLRPDLHGNATPFPSDGPAALMPMPLPVPPDGDRTRGIYLLGFLTGLGLSLMAGIALYVLINMV